MPAKISFLALFHKHWNSDLLLVCWSCGHIEIWTSSLQRLELLIIVILALFFQTLEFLSHSFTANIEILVPSFEKFEFWFYFYKHCNSHVILLNTGILALFFIRIGCVILFFKRLRFWPYFCKHWNYDLEHWSSDLIFLNIGILISSFETLEFLSCPSSAIIGIVALSFQTFEFWPYPYTHWNSYLILRNIEILTPFLHLNSGPILTNIGILILYFHCKHWNSGLILPNKGISPIIYTHCSFILILQNTGILALFL